MGFPENLLVPSPEKGHDEVAEVNGFANRNRELARSSQMVRHYRDSNGKARITGGADLKKSQSYPRLFFVPGKKSHWSIFEVLSFIMAGRPP